MDKNLEKISHLKSRAILAVGFGLGGLLWGLEAYRGTVGAGESFTNPFSYVLGAVALAVFGGHALAYVTKAEGASFGWKTCFGCLSSTRTIKIIGLGLVGWLTAFFLPSVWMEWMMVASAIITPILFVVIKVTGLDIVQLLILEPSLLVGQLWVHFLLAGALSGVVYSLILKTKVIRAVLWAAGGFALASLIGPIFGNLVGNLFGSLLVSYLVTFLIIGVIFGKFLSIGIYKKEEEGSRSA